MYNFDQPIERRHTNSVKWDECSNPDVLPLWVADMDFATAPCVQEAIVRRATHGCYGYTIVPQAYYAAIGDWFATRHQWNIDPQHILYTIGVIPAIAAVLKAQCQVGDNVVILTPVYNMFFKQTGITAFFTGIVWAKHGLLDREKQYILSKSPLVRIIIFLIGMMKNF